MNPMLLADTGTTVTSSLTGIATEITTTIAGIAPIAIGVVGVFMVWKFGMKFFKSLAGK